MWPLQTLPRNETARWRGIKHMLRWVLASSLQGRFLVLAMAAALAFFGASRLRNMPIDVFPEFQAPVVEVQTEALGLSAEEVESLVTINLEELLSGVSW